MKHIDDFTDSYTPAEAQALNDTIARGNDSPGMDDIDPVRLGRAINRVIRQMGAEAEWPEVFAAMAVMAKGGGGMNQ